MPNFDDVFDVKPFKEIFGAGKTPLTSAKPTVFSRILLDHGEAQVTLASGEVHSIHLGDSGTIDDECLSYKNRERGHQFLFWDQIEKIDFHRGYIES